MAQVLRKTRSEINPGMDGVTHGTLSDLAPLAERAHSPYDKVAGQIT